MYTEIINSLRGYLAQRLEASFLEPDCLLSNIALPLNSCEIFGELHNLLYPSILVCKMGIIIVPTSQGCYEDWVRIYILYYLEQVWHLANTI